MLADDRLEPSASLPDVAHFEELLVVGCRQRARRGTAIHSCMQRSGCRYTVVSQYTHYTAFILESCECGARLWCGSSCNLESQPPLAQARNICKLPSCYSVASTTEVVACGWQEKHCADLGTPAGTWRHGLRGLSTQHMRLMQTEQVFVLKHYRFVHLLPKSGSEVNLLFLQRGMTRPGNRSGLQGLLQKVVARNLRAHGFNPH